MTRILITGAAGQLGRDLVLAAERAGHQVIGIDRNLEPNTDITDRDAVRRAITSAAPELIIHGAAFTAVDACESQPELAAAVNEGGTRNIGDAADEIGAHVVYVSTDYVFDGTKPEPYVETDPVNPLSVYGRTKLGGELALGPNHTIARTSWVCSAHGPSMVQTIVRLAASPGELRFVDDQIGHPTFTADLAPALVALGESKVHGIVHVTNSRAVSWFEFAQTVVRAAGHDPQRVRPIGSSQLTRRAPRPSNSRLENRVLADLGMKPLRPFDAPLAEVFLDNRESNGDATGDERGPRG